MLVVAESVVVVLAVRNSCSFLRVVLVCELLHENILHGFDSIMQANTPSFNAGVPKEVEVNMQY